MLRLISGAVVFIYQVRVVRMLSPPVDTQQHLAHPVSVVILHPA